MTVANTPRTAGPYVGTGGVSTFTFAFKVFLATDVLAQFVSAAGALTIGTLGTDYSVSLNANQDSNPGGTVITTVPLASGATLTIGSQVPLDQEVVLTNPGGFYPQVISDALDKVTILIQQALTSISGAIRIPEIGSSAQILPPAAQRANQVLAFDSQGNPITVIPVNGSAASLAISLAASNGTSFLGWIRAAGSAIATTLQAWLGWQEISAFEFMTVAQIADYQTGAMTLDLTAPLQAWATAAQAQGLVARLPKGTPKITAPIALAPGVIVRGHGTSSRIAAWGCDAFQVNGDQVVIENVALFGYSGAGAADAKTNSGINCVGTFGTHINNFTARTVFLQGWQQAINWAYTWSSVLDNISTINCTYGVRLFGQSVNNEISNSRLTANGGQASIVTRMDGVTQGEGLMVSNCLLSSGAYGWDTDGWLSVGFYNCIADLISNIGFNNAGYTSGFVFDGPWVYAANRCFHFGNLGAANPTNATVRVGMATTTGSDSLFVWGTNNQGLSLFGSTLVKSAAGGNPVFVGGPRVAISGVTIQNSSGNPAVYVNALDVHINGLAGDTYVQWNVSPVKSIVAAATLALPVPNQDGQIQFVVVTGNTSIGSGINDVTQWIGKIVCLQFTGILTVTDSGNVKLNGNFVSTADDTLTLASDGTSWFEVCRSAN